MKKMIIASLAAAGVMLAIANQAHAGATLDAVKKKDLYNVVSVMVCLVFLTPMRTVNFRVLMSMFAAVLPLPYSVMIQK